MKKQEKFELINRKRLKGLLVENDYTYTTIAVEIGISRQCFYNKIRGDQQFNEHEIYVLRRLLGNDIFLD